MTQLSSVPSHLPLRNQLAFSSADVDELGLFLDSEQIIEKRALTLLNKESSIDSYMSNVHAHQVQYLGVHLGSDVMARSVPLKVAQVIIPFNGQLIDHTQGDELLALPLQSAIIHNPNYPVKVQWHKDTSALVIRVSEDLIRNVYQAMTAREIPANFRLGPWIDLTKGSGLSLLNIIRNIIAELGSDRPFNDSGRTIDLWEELLVTTLLTHEVDLNDDLLQAKNSSPVYHYVKRTIEYIDENIQETMTLNALANLAGVSVRTLQTGFKKSLGIGPMAYVRDRKLLKVYEQLLLASPMDTNVGDVAARWGFLHPSHFTKTYKLRFHELPSVTLHKTKEPEYFHRDLV